MLKIGSKRARSRIDTHPRKKKLNLEHVRLKIPRYHLVCKTHSITMYASDARRPNNFKREPTRATLIYRVRTD